MVNSILSFLLSLIGIKPILIEQEARTSNEEKCEYISSSAFNLLDEKLPTATDFQAWLSQLSKLTLCQILSSAIADYPQIADSIYHRHYQKDDTEESLKSIQLKARSIARQLDHLRPSEQFARASETANGLEQLVKSLHVQTEPSFVALLSFIILAQESLMAPTEVRQHIFYQSKFGRSLVLEMSSILKNFQGFHDTPPLVLEDWFQTLQDICMKLSRYDCTWEYRREYQDVVIMAERIHQQYRSFI